MLNWLTQILGQAEQGKNTEGALGDNPSLWAVLGKLASMKQGTSGMAQAGFEFAQPQQQAQMQPPSLPWEMIFGQPQRMPRQPLQSPMPNLGMGMDMGMRGR